MPNSSLNFAATYEAFLPKCSPIYLGKGHCLSSHISVLHVKWLSGEVTKNKEVLLPRSSRPDDLQEIAAAKKVAAKDDDHKAVQCIALQAACPGKYAGRGR